jgi:hypothetical protein
MDTKAPTKELARTTLDGAKGGKASTSGPTGSARAYPKGKLPSGNGRSFVPDGKSDYGVAGVGGGE